MGRRRSAVFIDGEAVKSDCGGRSNVPRAEKRARKAKRRPDSDQTEGRRELGAQERQQDHCSAAEAAEDAEKDARTVRIWNGAVTRWEAVGPVLRGMAAREVEAERPFTIQLLMERLRHEQHVGRDGKDVAINNTYAPAYARLLLRDMPEARPYLETRKSRFDGMA